MTYSITSIDGIDVDTAKLLKKSGIRTSTALLEAAKDTKGRKTLSASTGIDEAALLKWANTADCMRLRGLGRDYAELMREAGVNTVRDLKHRNAKRLATAMAAANERRRLVKFAPTERAVERWIEEAKTIELKISY
jgi:predicted RecB family nuclease